jgi:carbamoyltransferase
MELHGMESEHMMFTYTMKQRGFDAITHEDMSARAQILHRNYNEELYSLLEAFYEKTGCPMLLNTSFNVMGEPIVCSPEDAIRTFINSGLDALVIGNNLIMK